MSTPEKSVKIVENVGKVPTSIDLGAGVSVDLSFLPEEERKALVVNYIGGMIDLSRKAKELGVDVRGLKNYLDTLAHTTEEANRTGSSVTIDTTYKTENTTTTVVMGNTDRAKRGKLPGSEPEETNWFRYFIIGAILVIIIALI